MTWKPLAAILIASALGGCAVYREATKTSVDAPSSINWREVSTTPDRERLRTWHQAWDLALPKARAADPLTVAANPALFDPDRSLPNAAPPAGDYRCRTYKLGANGTATHDFTAYPWSECKVEDQGEVRGLYKVTGSQRPTGLLFRDTPTRMVFLGTLVLGDESSPLRYGTDATRDMVGYVDRIGPKRWRWVFPAPRFESLLDVIEMVPAS